MRQHVWVSSAGLFPALHTFHICSTIVPQEET